MITELNDYVVDISRRIKGIDSDVAKIGVDEAFAKQLHYLDCTRWNKAHTYRLIQTIDYTYMFEMSVALHIIYANPDDKTEEREQALLDRHYKNLEYENDNPPVVYDKKRGLQTNKFKARTKAKRTTRKPRESSASRKLKEHIAKINKLSFKIKSI